MAGQLRATWCVIQHDNNAELEDPWSSPSSSFTSSNPLERALLRTCSLRCESRIVVVLSGCYSGKVDITNETDLANEFYGFLQQFCE